MPQYSGSSTPTTNDKVQASVDWAMLYIADIGPQAATAFVMNSVAAHKSATLPGDTSILEAAILAQLKTATYQTSPTVGDNISALIV